MPSSATPPVQPPRSSAQLLAQPLHLSPKQREVLEVLQQFDEGARVVDIAERLDMHTNTARSHLDELVNHGAAQVDSAPAKGRGRPSLVFKARVPDTAAITREYTSLVSVLIELFGDPEQPSREAMRQAQDFGARWAKKMGVSNMDWEDQQEALSTLFSMFRDLGFDPTVEHEAEQSCISLHCCPFANRNTPYPSMLLCALHQGFLKEMSGERGVTTLKLTPYAADGVCTITVI